MARVAYYILNLYEWGRNYSTTTLDKDQVGDYIQQHLVT